MHAQGPLQADDGAFDRLEQQERQRSVTAGHTSICSQTGASPKLSKASIAPTTTCPTIRMTR